MHHTKYHTGAALLIFLTVFVLGISALLLSALNQQDQWSLEEDAQTTKVLAQAKEVLIGYAVSFADDSLGNYGFLPCPDIGPDEDDGQANFPEGVDYGNSCGINTLTRKRYHSSLGRFPWRTLGLPPLRDGAGECLWYAISGSYKGASSAKAEMLNEDSNGLFQVFASDGTTLKTVQLTGDTPETRAVAVIIAPGKMFPNQNRTPESSGGVEICGGNYNVANYLETDVAGFSNVPDEIKEFLTAQDTLAQDFNKSHRINDKIAYISREEIWEAIRKRSDFYKTMRCLTQITANCVAVYANTNTNFATGDKRLPWAAPMDLDDYRDDTEYDDDNTFLAGLLPNIVSDSNTQIGKTVPTVPNYLIVDPDSGDPTPPTECNFSAIQNSELTDCQTFFKRITSCNPNSINPNDKIWCDEGQVTTAERSDATFNYAYFYSTAVKNRCSQDPPIPPLTSAEETQCTTIRQIKNSNRAIKTFRPLWNNWKDHLFYAVANAYKPDATLPIPSCDNTNCLQFTKTNPTTGAVTAEKCAAVVIFAGKRLANQNGRNAPPPIGDPDTKSDFRNYLEGDNATHGNGRYQQLSISDQFNDIVYCIKGE